MIEDWIDELTKVWEIDDGRGGTVRSYRLFERDEMPDDIPLERPVALTFFDELEADYSLSVAIGIYTGTTEFNLTPDLNRRRIPAVLKFVGKILRAAAARMTLGGRVNYFVVTKIGLTALRYGNEAPHLGLEVTWMVKEDFANLAVSQ